MLDGGKLLNRLEELSKHNNRLNDENFHLHHEVNRFMGITEESGLTPGIQPELNSDSSNNVTASGMNGVFSHHRRTHIGSAMQHHPSELRNIYHPRDEETEEKPNTKIEVVYDPGSSNIFHASLPAFLVSKGIYKQPNIYADIGLNGDSYSGFKAGQNSTSFSNIKDSSKGINFR